MPAYRVLVRGEGLVVRRWLIFRRTVGFYATRFVAAQSRQAAEEAALRELRGEPRLKLAARRAATLVVEEVTLLDAESMPSLQPGIVFFPQRRTSNLQAPAP